MPSAPARLKAMSAVSGDAQFELTAEALKVAGTGLDVHLIAMNGNAAFESARAFWSDPALGLDTGDPGHEPGAGQIEGSREGLAVSSERRLFRNRRKAVRTAHRNPPERPGRSAKLPGNDSRVVHQIMVPASPPSSRRPSR